MPESTISAKDLDRFSQVIGDALSGMDSWERVESWLKTQPGVVDVKSANYLIKTEPPRKEIAVTFQLRNGTRATRVIDIILHPDQTFGLAGIHER